MFDSVVSIDWEHSPNISVLPEMSGGTIYLNPSGKHGGYD